MRFGGKALLKLFWRNKWSFIIPSILIPLTAVLGTYFVHPIYRAFTIIRIDDSVELTQSLEQLVGQELRVLRMPRTFNDRLRLEKEFKSSLYIDQLIKNVGLNKNTEFVREAQKKLARWPDLTLEKAMISIMQNKLENALYIGFVGNDQLKISLEYSDPYLARDIVQSLSRIFIAEKTKQRIRVLRLSQDFSLSQVERYEDLLKKNADAKTALEKEFRAISLDNAIITPENRRKIAAEIDAVSSEIKDEEELAEDFSKKVSESYTKEPSIEKSDELKRLEKEITNHLETIVKLVLEQSWDSPATLNFNARLNMYLDQIKYETNRLINNQFGDLHDSVRNQISDLSNVREYLDILYLKKKYLSEAYDTLQNKVGLIPEYQARLDQLDRERASLIGIRDQLQDQQSSSSISQAILRESNYQIIEPAQLPLRQAWPIKGKLIMIGLILGLVFGGCITVIVELTDNSFRKIGDVEEQLGVPVLGVIPRMSSMDTQRESR